MQRGTHPPLASVFNSFPFAVSSQRMKPTQASERYVPSPSHHSPAEAGFSSPAPILPPSSAPHPPFPPSSPPHILPAPRGGFTHPHPFPGCHGGRASEECDFRAQGTRMIPVYYFHSINVILFTQQIATELSPCALFQAETKAEVLCSQS